MGLLLAVPLVLVLFLVAVGTLGRSFQQGMGRARCAHCDAKLQRRRRGYATTCSKCGRAQPWAKAR